MENIDAMNLQSKELNKYIVKALKEEGKVTVNNPHSLHNIAIGLSEKGEVIVKGSTGFYTGGFLEGTKVVVEGNAGWYAGDNMMDGELIISRNSGCNAGAYFYGGTMVIYGSTGSRVGYGMKGGVIVVCGSAGRWAGQMTLGGKLIILGNAGMQIGESMYKGVIYVQDKDAEKKLGGNVFMDSLEESEKTELRNIFNQYDINGDVKKFKAIRPVITGRHTYTLFKPELKPESARKNQSL